ncbi:RnfABCDGE type electron transport complex subunit G [Vogesella indigofera]|uniref:RnfABCDGE type electron transport complex subunit G n=1 Tax=Vogesella indigofera TaxID=45465 RepID=UPI00234DA8CF|nr:RnfABCDGE type electron transport complex subunit G [Vogesella indigofera]MDC7704322.1 RnfABCDGE type electron transport complex subunit G [Vogesella indigofera]
MRRPWQQAQRSALILAGFAAAATLLLGGTWLATHRIVAANELAAQSALLAQTLPAASFDNVLPASRQPLPTAIQQAFGSREALAFYTARRQGRVSGLVFENVAPDGYSGRIRLLIGLLPDGSVHAVRVVKHQETPGLGDYIEIARSEWARQFDGKGAANLPTWRLRKDGGEFDYVSGATVSARAVTAAVGHTVAAFHHYRAALLPRDTP